jgi:hypothetical protein
VHFFSSNTGHERQNTIEIYAVTLKNLRMFNIVVCETKCVKQHISISKHKHITMSLYLDSLWYVECLGNMGGVKYCNDAYIQHDITKSLRTFLYICFVVFLLLFFCVKANLETSKTVFIFMCLFFLFKKII